MRRSWRHWEEWLMVRLMQGSLAVVGAALIAMLTIVCLRGAKAMSWAMLTQRPQGGYYMGEGGGVLNAITGSVCLGLGATALAMLLALPVVFYFQREYSRRSPLAATARLALDVLWGVPSIVYGAFGFILMMALGIRASLLGGIIALTLVELPIMVRAMDEVVRRVPHELREMSYSLGANRLETTIKVVWRQALPGMITAILLAFGRGVGDAAAVLFTAGYTDYLPSGLLEPVASLPLAVFFQLGTPFPEVQDRAYASGLILLGLVLAVSLTARLVARALDRYVIR